MENRVKARLSRIFQGSLNSCKARNLRDVVENAVLITQNDQPQPPSTKVFVKPSPLPSMCKPRHYCHDKAKANDGVTNSIVPRRKLYSFLAEEGFRCPPASPLSPSLKPFCKYPSQREATAICGAYSYKRSKKKDQKKAATTQARKRSQDATLFRSFSQDSAYYYNWFSSEEDEEEGKEQALEEEEENGSVFFSSRSNTLSSDSSGNVVAYSKRYRPRRVRRRRRTSTTTSSSGSTSHSSRNNNNKSESKPGDHVNVMPLMGGGAGGRSSVKDSFAVEKASSDPHNDFRTSMVEMIIEKQIFGSKELEQLLQCFLSLNSHHHHRTILQVFTEICEALFSNEPDFFVT